MGKPKTAKQVREEIMREYSNQEPKMLHTGTAEFSILGEKCYGEAQCLDIIRANKGELDKIIRKYFDVDGLIKDRVGNIYTSKEMAFDSIRDDCYNTHKKQFLDKINREGY